MNTDNILSKIEKLLARTEENGCTPEEAAVAATMVQKLIAKYHVDMRKAGTNADDVDMEEVPVTRRWQNVLLAVVAQNMRCKCVKHTHNRHTIIRVLGHKIDRQAVVETYMTLECMCRKNLFVEKLIAKRHGESTRGLETDYCLGFCDGVENTMEIQAKALVLVVPKEVNDYIDEHYGKLRKGRKVTFCRSDHYNKGYHDGQHSLDRKLVK